jgi:uncharacterized protein (DUF433 family)
MSQSETLYKHIVITASGTPIIADTTMKVITLILEQEAYGWSAEELHFQHPYLSLGQIYSALAYYWDHQEELDRDIEQRYALVNEMQKKTPLTPLHKRIEEYRAKHGA